MKIRDDLEEWQHPKWRRQLNVQEIEEHELRVETWQKTLPARLRRKLRKVFKRMGWDDKLRSSSDEPWKR